MTHRIYDSLRTPLPGVGMSVLGVLGWLAVGFLLVAVIGLSLRFGE